MDFVKGNLLESEAEALVNTVNTVGVMGKGIALQFKERFPGAFSAYSIACKNQTFKIGDILAYKDANNEGYKWILNFPTKQHWRGKSKYEYLEKGLLTLRQKLIELNIKSVAIPPLGCGNGGLDWQKVKPMIINALGDIDVQVIVYEPNDNIKLQLQKEHKPKKVGLTPARAMLLYALFKFESLGAESSLFVANKLAYFLQLSGEKDFQRLSFSAHHFGPYSPQLAHVVYDLNGQYLTGFEQMTSKAFEPFYLSYNKFDEVEHFVQTQLKPEQLDRLHSVLKMLQGFESQFSLELLATVAYLKFNEQLKTTENIEERLKTWSDRKANLFSKQQIEIAEKQLAMA